jgi:hypothetical protein
VEDKEGKHIYNGGHDIARGHILQEYRVNVVLYILSPISLHGMHRDN